MPGNNKTIVRVDGEVDIVSVRKVVRSKANTLGFGVTDVTRIVTAASELARNIFRFAGSGVMVLSTQDERGREGIILVFEDKGPGIENVEQAMGEGFTTGGGLGLGLPGTKRLMDEMEIKSEPGKGTTVRAVKWLN